MVNSSTDNKINYDKLSDSSEEEGYLSRIGNVPFEWYKNYDHIGYSVDGTRIITKTKAPSLKSIIQNAKKHKKILIHDELNDQIIELSKEELSLIKKIRHQKPSLKSYETHPEYNFGDESIVPLPWRPSTANAPEISKETQRTLIRLVKAIRNGWIVDAKEQAERIKRKKRAEEQKGRLLWAPQVYTENEFVREHLGKNVPKRFKPYVPVEKAELPGHEESYNPPAGCLFDEKEKADYDEMDSDERENTIVPRKIKAMRLIPHYKNSIKERYGRCVKIYAKPREVIKRRREKAEKPVEKEKLIDVSTLKPFPDKVGIVFSGHLKRVVSISVSFCGTWLASASEDQTIKIWEIETSRCVKTVNFNGSEIAKLSFSPSSNILAVSFKNALSAGSKRSPSSAIVFLSPKGLGISSAKGLRSEGSDFSEKLFGKTGKMRAGISFDGCDDDFKAEIKKNLKIKPIELPLETENVALKTSFAINSFSWHPKGRHVILSGDRKPFVFVLNLAPKKIKAQIPLKKCRKCPVRADFSENGKFLFVVFVSDVQIFELSSSMKYKQFKTTQNNEKTRSSSISPSGEHLLTGTTSGTLNFFDFEISSQPYRFPDHLKTVLCTRFHKTLPLFATASADGEAHVYHYKLPENYAADPEITAVAKLAPPRAANGGKRAGGRGLLECAFHPAQPWVFCCGHSSSVCMFVD